MKEIIRYLADDGSEFVDKDSCLAHEANCVEANQIMDMLPTRPDNEEFLLGKGYIQHDPTELLRIRNTYLELLKLYSSHPYIQLTIDGGLEADPNYVAEVVYETAPVTFVNHWTRFCCIDEKHREWGHPQLLFLPDQREEKCLNEKSRIILLS